jgi:hypothetical protein
MKKLTAGKTGPLKVASAKAVRTLMQRRISEGTLERPDVEEPSAVRAQVTVTVHAPKLPKRAPRL